VQNVTLLEEEALLAQFARHKSRTPRQISDGPLFIVDE
jgi:hypothetical protein